MPTTIERCDRINRKIINIIHERRVNLGLTLTELAAVIGVSYQQMHKYESGVTRLSAGKFFILAETLKIPLQDFYENHSDTDYQDDGKNRLRMEAAKHLQKIKNPVHLAALRQLIKTLAGNEPA